MIDEHNWTTKTELRCIYSTLFSYIRLQIKSDDN